MQWIFIYTCTEQEVILHVHALHDYRYFGCRLVLYHVSLHDYRYCECRLVLYHVSLHTNQKQCAVKYEYYHKIQGLRLAWYTTKTQQKTSGG